MSHVINLYLLLCALLCCVMLAIGAFEDLVVGPGMKPTLRGPFSEFKYNHNSITFWVLTLAISLPGVNLIVLLVSCEYFARKYLNELSRDDK